MSEQNKKLLMLISEIQALSQSGLTFNNSGFEKERYLRLTEISAELASICSNQPKDFINEIFLLEKGYATPKVDVRSFVLKDDKVLLVKERADGLWTLPGGFADVAETPSQAVIRETKEESGYDVEPIKLLALWDKSKHDHPLHWPHIYKLFFHCEYKSGKAHENLEISDIGFFAMDDIPPLSTPRVTSKQLLRLYQLVKNPELTVFD
jgi:ADP-ribose pyrophosphatase YjhB (NUDIX family)